MTTTALGKHYFGEAGFPLTAVCVEVAESETISHQHDLTRIPHAHDFVELVIIAAGRGAHYLEGQEHPISTGDVFVLQADQAHYFTDFSELSLINVMYDSNQLNLPQELLRKMPGYNALFILEPTYRQHHRFESRLHLDLEKLAIAVALADEIRLEAEGAKPGCEAAMLGRLLELITFLSRCYDEHPFSEGRALLRIGDLITRMEREYEREWTLDEVARAAGMSKGNVNRIFRQATGLSPVNYLIHYRVTVAQNMIRRTSLSVSEIAFRCGFNDSNYFARQFRKVTGISPTEYRKSQLG